MFVDITNLTDGPGKTPTQIAIYNATLDPGKTLRLPAELMDTKIKSLEKSGIISIGSLPAWYAAAKQRKGKSLTQEEQAKRTVRAAPPDLPTPRVVVPLVLSDEVEVKDEFSTRKRRGG